MQFDELSNRLIDCAIEVHQAFVAWRARLGTGHQSRQEARLSLSVSRSPWRLVCQNITADRPLRLSVLRSRQTFA